jgi:hypothetical protein
MNAKTADLFFFRISSRNFLYLEFFAMFDCVQFACVSSQFEVVVVSFFKKRDRIFIFFINNIFISSLVKS